MENGKKASSSEALKFGTFGGVFTPTTLTILGVIMFLRFSQVMGQAGVWHGLLIILAAQSITLLTTFSLSAIATNTKVGGGGAYYLISRTLGVEYGGVIGIFLFLAQAISVALYVIGFTEAFLGTFPGLGLSFRIIASVVNIGIFVCVLIGAAWTIKVQYGILAILILSLVSFAAGAVPQVSRDIFLANAGSHYLEGQSFFTVFALFFPAVTGIMAGVNMSGDLKDPARSIPSGTFLSIAFTGAIYLSMGLLLAAVRPQATLAAPGFIVKEIAWAPFMIIAGVFSATLSSALGSMMGAPRILQAFAKDDVFPVLRFFARGAGKSGEPRRATVMTFLIAQAAILLGDLDVVAPIITMFFMITYGTLNLACFYEGITKNPSFRPRFRFAHWSLSLAGALGCLIVMLLMNPLWAIVAIGVMISLYFLISRAEIIATWGDLSSGLAFQTARNALLRLEKEKFHPKNWRPTILALSGGAWGRNHLAEYANWLSAGRGVVTLAQVLFGEVGNMSGHKDQAEKLLRSYIREENLSAFPAVVVEEELGKGIKTLLQAQGIGGLKPNTVLMGWSDDPARTETFSGALRLFKAMGRTALILRYDKEAERLKDGAIAGAINIWWDGSRNGNMMLVLAHLLKQNRAWRNHPLKILCPVPPKADTGNIELAMGKRLETARIEAEILVLPTDNPQAAIRKAMNPSALLLAGFEPPEECNKDGFFCDCGHLVDLSGELLLVSSAEEIPLEV